MTQAPHNSTRTSKAAARFTDESGRRVTMKEYILRGVVAAGLEGLSCFEIEQRFGVKHTTASARLKDLTNERLILDSRQVVKTDADLDAIRFVARERFPAHLVQAYLRWADTADAIEHAQRVVSSTQLLIDRSIAVGTDRLAFEFSRKIAERILASYEKLPPPLPLADAIRLGYAEVLHARD